MCPHCGAPALYARGSALVWVVLVLVLSVLAFIGWYTVSTGSLPAFK
jgi:hypothetical protein